MSLSADRSAEIVRHGTMPDMLTPLFGRNAEKEKEEILISYPSFVPGSRQVIPDEYRRVYEYCMAAASYWADQKHGQKALAQNLIRYTMGDAEYGVTENGLVFVSRRIAPREGYKVDPGITDGIYPEHG